MFYVISLGLLTAIIVRALVGILAALSFTTAKIHVICFTKVIVFSSVYMSLQVMGDPAFCSLTMLVATGVRDEKLYDPSMIGCKF